MKVGIIGAGNVATHLVKGFLQAGVEITVLYSRTQASLQALSDFAPAAYATTNLDFQDQPAAEVYLISVPDQALAELAGQMRFPGGVIVAHTSGTQPIEVLQPVAGVMPGVFYPVQTFSKEKEVNWSQIPICVEGTTPQTEKTLQALGQRLSNQVVPMAGPARKQLHLAAVFACNFTNHLWGVAKELLQSANLPTSLLEPLAQETLQKASLFPPFTVQTGPAQRGDQSTIEAHLALLKTQPGYRQLYQVLTNSIQTKALEQKAGE